jgi:hypothetical protein
MNDKFEPPVAYVISAVGEFRDEATITPYGELAGPAIENRSWWRRPSVRFSSVIAASYLDHHLRSQWLELQRPRFPRLPPKAGRIVKCGASLHRNPWKSTATTVPSGEKQWTIMSRWR